MLSICVYNEATCISSVQRPPCAWLRQPSRVAQEWLDRPPSTVQAMMMAAGHGGPGVESDGRGVYVGGLPKHAEWQELKDHMKLPGTRTLGLSQPWEDTRGIPKQFNFALEI